MSKQTRTLTGEDAALGRQLHLVGGVGCRGDDLRDYGWTRFGRGRGQTLEDGHVPYGGVRTTQTRADHPDRLELKQRSSTV